MACPGIKKYRRSTTEMSGEHYSHNSVNTANRNEWLFQPVSIRIADQGGIVVDAELLH